MARVCYQQPDAKSASVTVWKQQEAVSIGIVPVIRHQSTSDGDIVREEDRTAIP